ncbi:MAG: hypothetical protein ACKVWV_02975 [Planctomycetota bacterium]
MTEEKKPHPEGEFDDGWEGHRRRQARLGLSLTPAERLRWLEETMATMRRLQGRARLGRPISEDEK